MPIRLSDKRADELAYCAELMVRLRSTYRVVQELRRRFRGKTGKPIDRATAMRWIAEVRRLRREEASDADAVSLRDEMRDSLNVVAALALGRTLAVKNDDGTVVMEDYVDQATGQVLRRPAYKPNPDLQRALHAFRELIHLDGLAQPISATIKLDGEVVKMPDLKALPEAAGKAVGELLKAIAPDGDVGKLAGEWFTFSGEPKS